jgi:hypothetical protein
MCVLKLFNKWRETSSVLDKKKLCPKRALPEQRLEDIRVRMEISPRKSSCRLAQECNKSKSSVLRGLIAQRFHPYKVSLVQKLNPADAVARINFCRWTLQCVHDGILDPTLLFMSDEAWFHLRGFMNIGHWDTENLHAVNEVPLHDQKFGVWCAVSGRRIIGPIFLTTR